MEKKYDRMLAQNKKINLEKKARAINCIEQMLKDDRQVVVSELVQKTGLSRTYFYNNPEVHEVLKRAQNLQKGKNFVKKQSVIINKALEKECDMLKRKLSEKEEEVKKLKRENKKLKNIVEIKEIELIKKL